MVHGFVNQAGRLEALTIVFPPEFRWRSLNWKRSLNGNSGLRCRMAKF
jgi:hypothetical protein